MMSPSVWGLDGHSGKETPGLIPNPEVKLIYVILSTMVREPMGKIPLFMGAWVCGLGGELLLSFGAIMVNSAV